MIYAITSSRNIGNKKELWPHIKKIVLNPEVSEVIFGGARGGDTEALLAALNFREDPTLKLTVVVPFKLEDQPKETIEVSKLADSIVELDLPKTKFDEQYKARNQRMVDYADRLMAFTTGSKRSGTWQTIRLAQKAGKLVTIVEVSSQ